MNELVTQVMEELNKTARPKYKEAGLVMVLEFMQTPPKDRIGLLALLEKLPFGKSKMYRAFEVFKKHGVEYEPVPKGYLTTEDRKKYNRNPPKSKAGGFINEDGEFDFSSVKKAWPI